MPYSGSGADDTEMSDGARQTTDTERWLGRFRERNGRAPTVLHIGNIANAAYLNARMLNEVRIDCDVLCYEYFHIMGCPEWESAVFDPNGVNPDRPDTKPALHTSLNVCGRFSAPARRRRSAACP